MKGSFHKGKINNKRLGVIMDLLSLLGGYKEIPASTVSPCCKTREEHKRTKARRYSALHRVRKRGVTPRFLTLVKYGLKYNYVKRQVAA
jgi:hypothetical protein